MSRYNLSHPIIDPLTPNDMFENDIDPESLKVITNILESPRGSVWLRNYIVKCLAESHIIIRSDDGGRFFGYIRAYDIPEGTSPEITIKPEDSWLKKWIKRQLM